MKRFIIALAVLAFLPVAYALPEIPDEFYLENKSITDDARPKVNVLPNTLRVILAEGEEAELYAETLPKGERIYWSISNDRAAEIYPNGEKCSVRGVTEGSAYIRVFTENSVPRLIAVEVVEQSEPAMRSFEYSGKQKGKETVTFEIAVAVLRALAGLGAGCLAAAIILFFRREKKK